MFLGYKWDGKACTPLGGCGCQGANCDALHRDEASCLAAQRGCTPTPTPCEKEKAAIADLLAQNQRCTTDKECTTVSVPCQPGGFCGSHYVNQSLDKLTLEKLSRELNQCVNNDPNRSCAVCAAVPPPAACVAGRCSGKW
jgi:hypothetical protein